MTAIITPKFSVFYDISKEDKFFANSKWVFDFPKSCFGRNFDSYLLAFGAENIRDINDIIDYLEMHNVKRIYE